MGAAADDLKLSDEERDSVLERRRQRAEAESETRQRDTKKDDVATSFNRLKDVVNGERPTRESNAEYRFRKMGGEARRALAR